jgi:hypothetical protein
MIRFRPRFSVRTLAIFVTLVCAYFGAWEATKRYGVFDLLNPTMPDSGYFEMYDVPFHARVPVPFLIASDQVKGHRSSSGTPGTRIELADDFIDGSFIKRTYYLWLVGPRIKLPIETDWKHYTSRPGPGLFLQPVD